MTYPGKPFVQRIATALRHPVARRVRRGVRLTTIILAVVLAVAFVTSVTIDLGPALREALASDVPTVIQTPMENAPTPTPGHWDINRVYRKGD